MLHLHNKNTSLSHAKGMEKSYRSRFVRGDDRIRLGQSVCRITVRNFHKRLANFEETSFYMGNLKDTPMSKNVLKQFSYEYRKSTPEDEDAIKSTRILEGKYTIELAAKSVPGFKQYFSINPFNPFNRQSTYVLSYTKYFLRIYQFRCSSNHCPSKEVDDNLVQMW